MLPQENPTKGDWEVWFNFWHKHTATGDELHIFLGKWLAPTHRIWGWYYSLTRIDHHRIVEGKAQHYLPASVGTLPDGYARTNLLPQVPTKQSVPTSRIRSPPYFGLPIVIPTLCMIMGPTIARARILWRFYSLNLRTPLCY
jgi:hypothetical protein